VIEEIFFRGFIFGGLWEQIGWVRAGLISSLLFGLAHLSVYLVLPFAAIGFLFAWSYRRTGSLLPGILAHAITNAANVAIAMA
jgi:membrane protease YdiL (CAAX protease family)